MNQAIQIMKGHQLPITRDNQKEVRKHLLWGTGNMLPDNVKQVIQPYTDSIGALIDCFFPIVTTSSVMQTGVAWRIQLVHILDCDETWIYTSGV